MIVADDKNTFLIAIIGLDEITVAGNKECVLVVGHDHEGFQA